MLFLGVSVRVLPCYDVVRQEAGDKVDVKEVFVEVLPLRPGGHLVQGLLL